MSLFDGTDHRLEPSQLQNGDLRMRLTCLRCNTVVREIAMTLGAYRHRPTVETERLCLATAEPVAEGAMRLHYKTCTALAYWRAR